MSDTYFCECCKQTKLKGWSDEEASEECVKNFGQRRPDDVTVCDDCYKMLMRAMQS